jgi:hypothetical protein
MERVHAWKQSWGHKNRGKRQELQAGGEKKHGQEAREQRRGQGTTTGGKKTGVGGMETRRGWIGNRAGAAKQRQEAGDRQEVKTNMDRRQGNRGGEKKTTTGGKKTGTRGKETGNACKEIGKDARKQGRAVCCRAGLRVVPAYCIYIIHIWILEVISGRKGGDLFRGGVGGRPFPLLKWCLKFTTSRCDVLNFKHHFKARKL